MYPPQYSSPYGQYPQYVQYPSHSQYGIQYSAQQYGQVYGNQYMGGQYPRVSENNYKRSSNNEEDRYNEKKYE